MRIWVFYGPGASFAPQELTDLLRLEEGLFPLAAQMWAEFAEPERVEESIGLLTSVTASTVNDWRGWTQAILVWDGSGMFAPGAGGGIVRTIEAPRRDATAPMSGRADRGLSLLSFTPDDTTPAKATEAAEGIGSSEAHDG
ncbi:hypothetical protein [Nocardia terpenica]|uniref:Uncharacterized protein n=1 Tax=Nocardia terpenica TaxID=455432 RepID=A0A164K6M9_9NOCA|nr:hypothetical protein [Nocardia terpenica]KZM71090.1 hypothetical protein AWN90_42010 [Nocardia terpenica]NQE89583.1 hypothetical protein [Nocardia terpenica]